MVFVDAAVELLLLLVVVVVLVVLLVVLVVLGREGDTVDLS